VLEALTICNFALIDNLALEFSAGLNILTGETGAGKSIIIDALGMTLGERASAEYIRAGAGSARVEACFSFPPGHPVAGALADQGIAAQDNSLVLARELNTSGRNVCRINGHLVTTTQLKEIAAFLVDIHGQHQHQSLLNPGTHLSFLDALGGTEHLALVAEVRQLYQRFLNLKAALKKYAASEQERARRQEVLSFQVKEIDAAKLRSGELEELKDEQRILAQQEKLLTLVQAAYGLLYGAQDEAGTLAALSRAQALLQEAAAIDKRLASLETAVAGARYGIEEAIPELRHYQENFSLDPGRLEAVEDRLHLIGDLARKYGATVEEILAYREQAACELEELARAREDGAGIKEELSATAGCLAERAAALSRARRELAAALETELTAELADLGMAGARFKVAFSYEEDPCGLPWQGKTLRPGPDGFDRVEFLLAANPGEPPRPLARIASGGELSRVMLAIKTILAAYDSVPTLIFDEVDAGIGGRAAQAVAAKLAEVSRYHQVICITHLPQIAALGDVHFQISKAVRAGKTFTEVAQLTPAPRIEELGRMLAGAKVTAAVRQHAAELLAAAAQLKKMLDLKRSK